MAKEPRHKSGSLLSRMFDQTFWMFVVITLVAAAGCWWLKGYDALIEAFHDDLELLVYISPRILLAMLIAGFAQVLLPRDKVAHWVGEQSGWRGLVIATAAGALTPGGPITSFPFVLALYMAGADRGALVAYLTAWALLGFQRVMMWEIPLMGMDFAVMRSLANLPLPLIAGYIARQLPGLPARTDSPAEEQRLEDAVREASQEQTDGLRGEGDRRG
jgi:uncharacterized membrane protein YraQ (UPF0718 family)